MVNDMPKKYHRYRHGGEIEILSSPNATLNRDLVIEKSDRDARRGNSKLERFGYQGGGRIRGLERDPRSMGSEFKRLGAGIREGIAGLIGKHGPPIRLGDSDSMRLKYTELPELMRERMQDTPVSRSLRDMLERERMQDRVRGHRARQRKPLRTSVVGRLREEIEKLGGRETLLEDMTPYERHNTRRLEDMLESPKKMEYLRRRSPMRRAYGGIIGLQAGGNVQPGANAPPQYQGYGAPAQIQTRQEFLSPEVRQPYAQLTQGIMAAGTRPLQQFGPGVAGFTPMEGLAQSGVSAYGQGAGPQGTQQAQSTFGQAARGIGSVLPGQQAIGAQYGALAPQAFQQAQAGALGMGQLGQRAELQGQLAGAGMRTTGTEAQRRLTGLGGGMAAAGQQALAAQQEFGVGLPSEGGLGGITGMGAAAEAAGTKAAGAMRGFGETAAAPEMLKSANLQDYMSQYAGAVTDPQLRQLQEFQKEQAQMLGSEAAGAGAFGGYRQAVQQGQQAQAASQQAADIIGTGRQQAFESAQQAFERDRAAKAAGLGQQLSAEQQAAAAGQQGIQAQMAAQQQAAQMADVGAGRKLQGLQARIGAVGQGAQFGLQAQQQGFGAAQAGTQQALAAREAAGQLGQQGFGTAADLMRGQQGALGAQLGAYGQLAEIGGQQAALGGQQQQQQFERLRQMEQAGVRQRQLQQAGLDYQRQQFQQRQQYPQQQLGWMGQMLGSLPYQNIVQQGVYTPQAGPMSGLMAAGLGANALYNAQFGQPDQTLGTRGRQEGGVE